MIGTSFWATANSRINGQKYRFCDFYQNGTFQLRSLRWTSWVARVREVFVLKWVNETVTSLVYRTMKNRVQLPFPFFHLHTIWDQSREDGCNECCIGLGTHTTTLIRFISSTLAVFVRFSVVKLKTRLSPNLVFSFIDHLYIISPQVVKGLRSFWSHSKRNWVLYNTVCITSFQPLGTFHLGLTHISSQWTIF